MEKIIIKIPNNLTPEQEVLAIAKHLGKSMLPNNQMLLGDGYDIIHKEMQITVKREEVKKPIMIRSCPICDTMFAQNIGFSLWTNYGGNRKNSHYCSDSCRENVLEACGSSRAAINKRDLMPCRKF